MYNIYHIPEFVYSDGSIGKIGVSHRLTGRMRENLKKSVEGFSNWEVLEEHKDIYKVSDREIELQKQYGYKVDTIPYWRTINMATKEGRIKGGKKNAESGHMKNIQKIGCSISGKQNVESGHLARITKLANIANRKPIIQYDLDGNIIREYNSVKAAGLNFNTKPHYISRVLRGERAHYKGYTFKYKE
jgi:hypothetical protein